MNLTLLSNAWPMDVVIHLAAALLAVVLGPLALLRRSRDIWHKRAGYLWVTAMAVTAASSFWLDAVVVPLAGGFGIIHLLSVWVFWVLWQGVQAARRGDVATHQAQLQGLYWQGLLVAGAFTLFPGRKINDVLFSARPDMGYIAIAGLLVMIIAARLLRWPRAFAAPTGGAGGGRADAGR